MTLWSYLSTHTARSDDERRGSLSMSHVSVRTLVCALALSALAIGGCSSTPETRSIDAWLGAEPHFDVVGTINGETLDV